jgi:hypothetical protein
MKNPILLAATLIVFITFGMTGYSQIVSAAAATSAMEMREKLSDELVTNLSNKNYAAARKDFAKVMLDAMSVEKQKEAWEGLIAKVGAFQKVLTTKEEIVSGYNVIKKRCQFAGENATIQVTFNEENKVIGLYFKL